MSLEKMSLEQVLEQCNKNDSRKNAIRTIKQHILDTNAVKQLSYAATDV